MASQELPTKSRNEYKQLAHIGRGAYGDVFLYEHADTGERVCMKEIDLTFHSPHERARCLNEVDIFQHLPQHPHIVGFRDAFWVETDEAGAQILVLVLEYADGGDLEQHLRSLSGSPIQEDEARRIFKQLAQAVYHLHSHRVVHRDLKCGNVFLFRPGRVVLGDFGTSKLLPPGTELELEAQGLTSTVVGSPLYMSPELLEGDPHGFATDLWSLGCVMYELFSGGKPAFAAPSYPAVVYKITQGQYDLLDSALVSSEVQNLIASMLCKAPQERPTIVEILQSPWLQREDAMELSLVESITMNSGVKDDRPDTATSALQQKENITVITVGRPLSTPPIHIERVYVNKHTQVSTSDRPMPPPAPVHRAVKSSLRQRDVHLQGRAASPLIQLDILPPPPPILSSRKNFSPTPFKHYHQQHRIPVQSNSLELEVRGVQISRTTRPTR